jgi:hypothetical protein
MGYYQGDYYAGARGDPGFFGFLGGLAKTAVGFIPGVGPVASKALAMLPSGGLAKTGIGMLAKRGLAGMVKHPVLSAAGAAGAIGMGAAGVRALKGRHPAMVGGRRHRRMNVCNHRALRRAIRRTHGFAKMAKKVLRFTEAHPKRGRMTFKPVRHAPKRKRA